MEKLVEDFLIPFVNQNQDVEEPEELAEEPET